MDVQAAARTNMVESQVRPSDVTDVRIHDAMRRIAREDFVAPGKQHLAYADASVPYAEGRWLLAPRWAAKLLQAVAAEPGERALAIAAPYLAAVLEAMDVTVERLDGDDLAAVPGKDYDIIVCEGGVYLAPEAWVAALGEDGRLGVVERDGPVGKACVYMKSQGVVGRREVFDATPPVLPGFERQQGFAF